MDNQDDSTVAHVSTAVRWLNVSTAVRCTRESVDDSTVAIEFRRQYGGDGFRRQYDRLEGDVEE